MSMNLSSLENLVTTDLTKAETDIASTTQTVTTTPTLTTGVNSLISGLENGALKEVLQKYWPYLALAGVGVAGVIALFVAAPLIGGVAEYEVVSEIKKKGKNLFNENHDWIRLRLRPEEDFRKGAMRNGGDFATIVLDKDTHMIIGKLKGENKTTAQSMRFKTKEALQSAIPDIEEKYNTEVVLKEGEDYGLATLKEVKKHKKTIKDIKLRSVTRKRPVVNNA